MDLGTVMEQYSAKSKKQKGTIVQVCYMRAAFLLKLPLHCIAACPDNVARMELQNFPRAIESAG